MKFSRLHKRIATGFLGVALIAVGGAVLTKAQRQPAPQIFRIGTGGAYLGIEMEDVTAENMAKYKLQAETGVIIRSVEKGSPAGAARLQENDVIVEYAGIPVFSAAQLSNLVQDTPVNRTINLGIVRDGKKMTLSVKAGERDQFSGRLERLAPNILGRDFQFGGNTFRYAVPRESGRRLDDLLSPKPQLGVEGIALTDQMAAFLGTAGKKGVLVVSVTSGSPAAAVLKAGDVILAVDGKPVGETTELGRIISGKTAGSKAELRIVRDKKEISVTVEFPKSPAQRGIKL
jgi:S1-C subfamily serine protease